MRVLIADDQPQVRSALHLLLEERADIVVVGEAGGMTEVLELLHQERPDMLLLDWELPCRDCLLTVEALRAENAALTVIALSSRSEARSKALAAGADAFVSKGDPPEFLLATIQQFLR